MRKLNSTVLAVTQMSVDTLTNDCIISQSLSLVLSEKLNPTCYGFDDIKKLFDVNDDGTFKSGGERDHFTACINKRANDINKAIRNPFEEVQS